MKKTNILLSIGGGIALSLPLAAVISCSNSSSNTKTPASLSEAVDYVSVENGYEIKDGVNAGIVNGLDINMNNIHEYINVPQMPGGKYEVSISKVLPENVQTSPGTYKTKLTVTFTITEIKTQNEETTEITYWFGSSF